MSRACAETVRKRRRGSRESREQRAQLAYNKQKDKRAAHEENSEIDDDGIFIGEQMCECGFPLLELLLRRDLYK